MKLLPYIVDTFVKAVGVCVGASVVYGTLHAGTKAILFANEKIESFQNPCEPCPTCGRK